MKNKLNPHDPDIEIGHLCHEIVARLAGIPVPEVHQNVGVEVAGETCLCFDQWLFESNRQEQEEEQGINELDKNTHFFVGEVWRFGLATFARNGK